MLQNFIIYPYEEDFSEVRFISADGHYMPYITNAENPSDISCRWKPDLYVLAATGDYSDRQSWTLEPQEREDSFDDFEDAMQDDRFSGEEGSEDEQSERDLRSKQMKAEEEKRQQEKEEQARQEAIAKKK